jgi:hypothetical protein
MVCFQTKSSNLGKFWSVLQRKILVYFTTIWSILRPLEILYGHLVYFAILRPLEILYGHLVYFVVIWYIFPVFGIWDREKSGNLAGLAF